MTLSSQHKTLLGGIQRGKDGGTAIRSREEESEGQRGMEKKVELSCFVISSAVPHQSMEPEC